MNLALLPITYEDTVHESYLDSMGHMNVMWYTHLFGRATGGLMKLASIDKGYFAEYQVGVFALAQFFSYRSEVRVGQRVTLRSRLLGRSERKFHIMHFMTKDDEQVLAATAEFLGAHIDMGRRRTAPFAPHIAAQLDELLRLHSELPWEAETSGAIHL